MKAKRKNVRFNSTSGTIAEIDLRSSSKKFSPTVKALVLTESYGGCSVVLANTSLFTVGQNCLIKVGDLAPLKAEVRWVLQLDEHIQKVGFQFLE